MKLGAQFAWCFWCYWTFITMYFISTLLQSMVRNLLQS